MARLVLKPDRERSVLRRHPWVFDGAVDRMQGSAELGETVEIVDCDGVLLALAAFSPSSRICARLWTVDLDATIDASFFRSRVRDAIALRRSFTIEALSTSAERLVNAESDGLPGVIVDRYADVLVCQFLSAGAELWRDAIVDALVEALEPKCVFERSDADVRDKEGLEPRSGLLRGVEPPPRIEIEEGPCRHLVDVRSGHKTGFYLDQRDNRALLRTFAAGKDVLNCFSYSGAFGLHALAGGAAHVTNLDTSAAALDLAAQQLELNGFDESRCEQIEGDAFVVLRRFRDARRSFDVIVLDPPKFAESKAQVDRAARGYKDVNLLAFKLLRPGGRLVTFSCSGAITPELFQKIVADAALDARRDARIVHHLRQAPDHPVSLAFPEGLYLKGLVCAA